jgi:hypothetical protein
VLLLLMALTFCFVLVARAAQISLILCYMCGSSVYRHGSPSPWLAPPSHAPPLPWWPTSASISISSLLNLSWNQIRSITYSITNLPEMLSVTGFGQRRKQSSSSILYSKFTPDILYAITDLYIFFIYYYNFTYYSIFYLFNHHLIPYNSLHPLS